MYQETKQCQNCQSEFTIEPEDFVFYEKIKVPAPTFCWLCRAQRRMAFRNERFLHKRKSDSSGKEIFSAFSAEFPGKVYEVSIWNSDQWEPMEYARDYDFSRPFFEQFKEFLRTVPLKNLNLVNPVRSDYCNNFTNPKNCYLTFNGQNAEDCMYGNGYSDVKDSVDTSHLGKSENCYEGLWLTSCSNTMFSTQCENSYNLAFCKNMSGCHDCFGCVGLRNRSYHIFNKPLSKENYEKALREFDLSSHQKLEEIKKKTKEFWMKFPNKFMEGTHSTNVSGNYISHSKNVRNCFLVREGENLKYCQYVQESPGSKDSYDYTAWGAANELIYECVACGLNTNSIKFCYNVQENVHDIEYSYMCASSSYLFGCIGLKQKQYCIFNKQYVKEEYEELRSKIIEQMNSMPYKDSRGIVYKYGEYFPIEVSPFPYNETLAQEYFPLTRDKAKKIGYAWHDQADRNYKPTLLAENIPDRLEESPDLIASEIIKCAHQGKCNDQCTTAFKIIPAELAFYKKHNIALPRLCPHCRHAERISQRSKIQLYPGKCQCSGSKSSNGIYTNQSPHFHGEEHCPNEFETSYAPEREEVVYCERCYQQEVV